MELLKFVGTRNFRLIPIGNVRFSWKKRKGCIHIGEIWTKHDTKVSVDVDTYKMLIKAMKKAKTDLLTDGTAFFTTTGESVTQIEHSSFNYVLIENKDLIHELRFGSVK